MATPNYGLEYFMRRGGQAMPAETAGETGLPAAQPANTYTVSPTPTAGRGAFGAVPGQVGLPDIAGQLEEQLPGVKQINREVSGNILSGLRGELSPDTVKAIQDASASFGVSSGMPGSGLAVNRGLRDIGLTSEQVQNQALQNYSNAASTVANTQVISPEAQIQTAIQNALNAAAPDPTAAASYSQALFNNYMSAMNPPVTTQTTRPTSAFGLLTETNRTTYDPLSGRVSRRTL